jgi:hypothetical protein
VSTGKAHNIDARTAELIARQINSGYMNACGFGIDHPTSERAYETLHQTLSAALEQDPSLSLILDRGTLFIEKHPVGARFNPKRMVDAFNEIGLESITFDAGISLSDTRALMATLSNLLDYDSLSDAEAELARQQSGSIRFNYIVYRKVTSDQKVVGGDEEGEDPGESVKRSKPPSRFTGGSTAPGARVLDQLDSFLSMGGLSGDTGGGEQDGADSEARARMAEHLKQLAREIELGGGELEGISAEQLFTAMNSLRQRVHKSMANQQDIDRIMAESGDVVSEVDELTYSTLVSLVREEYRGGKFSVKRMAQIINRMLPDAGDLKRLLPRLRQGLVEEGMAMDQYAELVHELSTELRGEHLVHALETGAENVGLDVDELVRQIQEDPTEAARLVVLATELRQGGVKDDGQLSSAFTDYIERVSQQLALSSFADESALDNGTLGDQLERVQKELLERMSSSGLAPDAAAELARELEQRMPKLRAESKLALFDQMLDDAQEDDLTDTLILDWLEKQVDGEPELRQLGDSLRERLERHGYSAEEAERLVGDLKKRLKTERKPTKLPSSVLTVSNTALFLKHEVRSAQRYGNPFSAIKLLVEWLVPAEGGEARRPRKSDMGELLPELYFRIVRLARDLDLVGSLEKSQRAVPFIILPMTEEAGAKVFRERLIAVLAEFPFRMDRGDCFINCTITAVGFDTEQDEDPNAFIRRLNKIHQDNRAKVAKPTTPVEEPSRSSGAA